MAKILLLDGNHSHATALATALEHHNFSVTVRATEQEFIAELQRSRFDVVILDISHSRVEDSKILDRVRQLRMANFEKPQILCLSRVYRGPRERIAIEQRGGRLIYE